MAHYLGGLRSKISNVVQLQPYWTYNDVCKLALKVERQLKEGRKSTYQPFNQGGITNRGSSSTTKTTPYPKNLAVKPAKSEAKQPAKNEVPAGSNHSNTSNSSRKCFKCHSFGHIASDCPNCNIISLIEEDLEDDEVEPVDEESKEDLTYTDQGESLVSRRILKSTYVEEEWLRNNIFHTKCTSDGKVCNVIIDGGSCENVISTTMVEIFRLQWLKRSNDIQVTKKCLVQFSIGKNYKDEVLCDVVPMDACHILLGRP